MTPGNVISAIVVLVVFIFFYLPTIISTVALLIKPEKIVVSLVPFEFFHPTYDSLVTYSEKRTGVTDYNVEIYVRFETTSVEVSKRVRFHVEITDIEKRLQKPYFYVFLVNNSKDIISVFPEETYLSESYKLPKWRTVNDRLQPQNGMDSLSIPRWTLTNGIGHCWKNNVYRENCEIWFERQLLADPGQIGRWELWVFVFDEQYRTLEGKELLSENAITYVIYFFDVTSKIPPEETSNLGFYLWLVSSAATVIVSYYGMFRKVSPWINTHSEKILGWWTRNKGTIAIAIIVAMLDAVLLLLRV